jgi:hypothetical protein
VRSCRNGVPHANITFATVVNEDAVRAFDTVILLDRTKVTQLADDFKGNYAKNVKVTLRACRRRAHTSPNAAR